MNSLIQMQNELESHRLEVILVPLNPKLRNYNEGGCKRALADQNAKWYRLFAAQHPSSRGTRRGGFDTRIRRQGVLRALGRMVDGDKYRGKYRDELLSIAAGIVS